MWKMTHLLRDTEESRYQDDVIKFTKEIKLVNEKRRPGLIALGILEEWAEKESMTKNILRHSYVLRYYLKDNHDTFNAEDPINQKWAREARRVLNLCLNSDNGYIGEDSKNANLVHLTGKGSLFADDPVWRLFGICGPKVSFGLIEAYWNNSKAIRNILYAVISVGVTIFVATSFREQAKALLEFLHIIQ